MRTFRNESPVQYGHLVQRRYDFYGDDTVKRSRVTSGTIVSATSNQVYLDSAAQSVINLLTRSEEFDHADWVKSSGVTVTPNTDVAPDGTLSVDTINLPSAGGFEYIHQAFDIALGSNACSIYLSGSGTIHLDINTTDISENILAVTLTGTLIRYSLVATKSVAPAIGAQVRIISYPGDTATVIKAWGAQLEQSSSAGHYLKTIDTTASDSDFYNNYGITIDSGTGAGQDHLRINDYTVSLSGSDIIRVADLSGDWLTIPDSTSKYSLIERGY